MATASAIRLQIETALARRIPSALTPVPRIIRPVAETGIPAVDHLLAGGLPIGAISEFIGAESTGRTSLALSFLAHITHAGRVAAWIDVEDTLDPESAAAAGVDLNRMLWVRCGVSAEPVQPFRKNSFQLPEKFLVPPLVKKGLHGNGCGGHPRAEIKGLSNAVSQLLRNESRASSLPTIKPQDKSAATMAVSPIAPVSLHKHTKKPWARIEQALRVADLLLQAGGFAAIVFDMAGIAPEYAVRVPMATWFRYRTAVERSQGSLLLLTQHPCAKSSAELSLRFQPGRPCRDEATVFTGIEHCVDIERRRFTPSFANVTPLRKSPARELEPHASGTRWRSQSTWTGAR